MNTLLKFAQLSPPRLNGSNNADNGTNYEDMGYQKAQKASGHFMALEGNLNALYEEYKEKIKSDIQRQDSMKLPYKRSFESFELQNAELVKIIKKERDERIPLFESQIEQLKEDIADVKCNPQNYLNEKTEKISYNVGMIILVFLTLYLLIFYSSCSYSAFFRVFTPGVNVREAMLDPNTFIKAYQDGIGELIFILLMPFIFLALGYLIHKFVEKKSVSNYLKICLLLIVTFVFDGFLAYKISDAIYWVNGSISTEDYTVAMALKEVDFWIVIFAGFLVYVVWGVVFDFFLKAHQNLDRIGMIIKVKLQNIHEKEELIHKVENNIENYQNQINSNNIEIIKYKSWVINPVIEMDDINLIHYQFFNGWINLMLEHKMSHDSIKVSENIAVCCLETFKNKLSKAI